MNQEQVAGTATIRGVFTGKGSAATNGVAWDGKLCRQQLSLITEPGTLIKL